MSKRTIIRIDEALCNGCGQCVTACAEGALELVDGKARLVKPVFCDGFGDCVGECPTGALTIETREVEAYDPAATRRHLEQAKGAEAVARFDEAARRHAQGAHSPAPKAPVAAGGGCPGLRMRQPKVAPTAAVSGSGLPGQVLKGELAQWPIQLHLVPPDAPFFKGRELVVLSTCAPIASADVHWRFIRGRAVAVGCPKLDRTEGYVEKLAGILSEPSIPKVLVVRMEVPCCGGLTRIVAEAVRRTGREDLAVEEVTVGTTGEIIGQTAL